MPRIPKKTTAVLAEARAYGETLGKLKAEAHFRTLNVGETRSLAAHVGKFFDAMASKVDPLDLAAIAASTFLLHQFIFSIAGFAASLQKSFGVAFKGLTQVTQGQEDQGILNLGAGTFGLLGNLFGIEFVQDFSKGIQAVQKAYETPSDFVGPRVPPGFFPDTNQIEDSIELWLIAFLAAFVLVRFGPSIIQSLGGFKGLLSLVGGLAA